MITPTHYIVVRLRIFINRFRNKVRLLHLCNYVLFILFCYIFLLNMESDILALSFHKLTKHYLPDIAGSCALLFTLLFTFVHVGINQLLHLKGRNHAISFLPSFLCLACLTGIVPEFTRLNYFPLIIGLAAFVFLTLFRPRSFRPHDHFWTMALPNALYLLAGMLFVTFVSNTDDRLHYELRIQRHLQRNQYVQAMNIGARSLTSGRRLLALRALTLSRAGQMGERLFEYPIDSATTDLFLHPSDAGMMILPPDSLMPVPGFMPTEQNYLSELEKSIQQLRSKNALADYWLCTLLLQKRLDDFAQWLPRFYGVITNTSGNHLPRHYREALILYRSLFIHPRIIYRGTSAEITNYSDFMELSEKYTDYTERRNRTRRLYGNCYWWHYYFN